MPSLHFLVAATTTDALANRKFAVVPQAGAIINMWATCITVTDTFGLSIGDRDIMVDGSIMNIETGVVDVTAVNRDQLIFNEVISGGQLFLPVTVTTNARFLIHLRYL